MPAYKYETQDGKKLWYCSFHYIDWTGENKRKKKKGFSTKKEALEWEREFLDKTSENPEMLFSSLVYNYMKDCSSRFKPTTLENKQYIYNEKLLPYFGNMKICDITAIRVRKWQSELMDYKDEKGNPYSETYLKTIHTQLSAVMNYAVKYYGLKQNPCHSAGSIGKSKADEMSVWSRDQFETFIQYEKRSVYHLAFNLLFYSGIREGELLALTPEDICMDEPIIRITKSYAIVDGEEYFLTPKTIKSKRDVHLHQKLYDELLEYVQGAAIGYDERIFYFKKNGLYSEFKRILAKADLPPIRVHDLRHSHASMLIHMGVPITEISNRLGHDNPEITLRVYSHMYPGNARNISELINDLVSGNNGQN